MHAPLLPDAIHVIERDWLNSNQVLLRGPVPALIDSGYGTCTAATLARLRAPEALGAAQLGLLVNTHCHSDHMGGNAALQRRYGCRVLVPGPAATAIRAWDERTLWLTHADHAVEPFVPDAAIAIGSTFALGATRWTAFAAPGHDMTALMYWCADHRVLVTGDALWEHGFGTILPGEAAMARLEAASATLDAIARLAPAVVIPGHGAPFAGVTAALDRARRRVEAFRDDPRRMARNAARAFLAFKLLETGGMPAARLPDYVARVGIFRDLNREAFGMTSDAFAAWLIDDLTRAGVAAVRDGALRPAG
jgi:glyoxylase-like metal-dependent hydrolase (beta-lactamase superfamily II)